MILMTIQLNLIKLNHVKPGRMSYLGFFRHCLDFCIDYCIPDGCYLAWSIMESKSLIMVQAKSRTVSNEFYKMLCTYIVFFLVGNITKVF